MVDTVYKSKEGKQLILDYYAGIRKGIKYEYNETYVKTSYGETYLFEAGDKSNPIVMLFHGSCSSSAMWYSDIEKLLKDYHVVSVDILGEPGNSAENRWDLNENDYGLWINELVDYLKVDKVTLVGNSLGGWMSLKYASHYPERVDKMILIAPSGIVQPSFSFVFKSIIYSLQGEKGIKKIGKLILGVDNIPDEVMYFNTLIAKHFNPLIGALPIFTDEQLTNLSMPIMLVCGENDVTMNAHKAAERLKASTKNTKAWVIKDNGHVVYNIVDNIIDFIKDNN